jgi:FkbM family methyltransferase
MNYKKLIKSGFHLFGLDVVRRKNSPALTLLGLQSMSIRTIIDVGANTGQFAKKITEFFPTSKIYCFEPLPGPFGALSEWAATQGDRVVPFNLAIGDKEGEVEMFLHEDHTPSSSLLATTKLNEHYYPFMKGQQRISVRQMTLDEALAEMHAVLADDILIKLDVQGYEDRVIAGGREVLAKAKACILEVNVDSLYEGQADFMQLVTMLYDLGYRYVGNLDQAYAEDGHCIYLDSVFLKDL